jgi:hypothetical protein
MKFVLRLIWIEKKMLPYRIGVEKHLLFPSGRILTFFGIYLKHNYAGTKTYEYRYNVYVDSQDEWDSDSL